MFALGQILLWCTSTCFEDVGIYTLKQRCLVILRSFEILEREDNPTIQASKHDAKIDLTNQGPAQVKMVELFIHDDSDVQLCVALLKGDADASHLKDSTITLFVFEWAEDIIGERGDVAICTHIAPAIRAARVPLHLRFFCCNLGDRAAHALSEAVLTTNHLLGLSLHCNPMSEEAILMLETSIYHSPAGPKIWNNAPTSSRLNNKEFAVKRNLCTFSSSTDMSDCSSEAWSTECSDAETASRGGNKPLLSPSDNVTPLKAFRTPFFDEDATPPTLESDPIEEQWNVLEKKEKDLMEQKKHLEVLRKAKEKEKRKEYLAINNKLRSLTLTEIELEANVLKKKESYAEERIKSDAAREALDKCLAKLIKKEKIFESGRRKLLTTRQEIQALHESKAKLEGDLKRLQKEETPQQPIDIAPCPICYSSYKDCNRRALQCGHVFCAECVGRFQNEALKTKRICPICRSPITLAITLFT